MSPTAAMPELGRFLALRPERSGIELLIVAPHPDDEVIGPGGRALLAAEKGVGAIVVTDGARGAGGRSEAGLAAVREEESIAGMKVVGGDFVWFLRLRSPSVQADPGPAADAIAAAVARFRPRTVVTTSPYERHPTHLATLRATIAALRRSPSPPQFLGIPVWDPVPGNDGVTHLDVTPVVERKLEAIRCHATQLVDRPFDRTALAQMERDGTLAELTGRATMRYAERYLDLGDLVRPGAPALREWLRRRFERDADARLGAGRND